MADLQTNIVISADTSGLAAGMATATAQVQRATAAMQAQFAGLGGSARRARSEIDRAMRPIEHSFGRAISSMVLGTTSLQQAVARVTRTVIGDFVEAGVRMLSSWVASELGMTAASEAGAAARSAAQGEGLASGLAMMALNAIKAIFNDSAQTFAGVFAFLAPLLGPAAAGPAGAAAATVSAAAGSIASAAGGWVVPSDQLAFVHRSEMILPADLSQGLQGMIAGGGGGGNPVVVNVSAIDSQDVRRFFHNNGSLLVAALNKALRNGAALRSG